MAASSLACATLPWSLSLFDWDSKYYRKLGFQSSTWRRQVEDNFEKIYKIECWWVVCEDFSVLRKICFDRNREGEFPGTNKAFERKWSFSFPSNKEIGRTSRVSLQLNGEARWKVRRKHEWKLFIRHPRASLECIDGILDSTEKSALISPLCDKLTGKVKFYHNNRGRVEKCQVTRSMQGELSLSQNNIDRRLHNQAQLKAKRKTNLKVPAFKSCWFRLGVCLCLHKRFWIWFRVQPIFARFIAYIEKATE